MAKRVHDLNLSDSSITLVSKKTKNLTIGSDDADRSSYLQCINNRYLENHAGPYIVYIEDKSPENNLGNYYDIIFSKKLNKHDQSFIQINKKGPSRFVLTFKLYSEANKFIEDKVILLVEPEWVSYIPDHAIYIVGIVYDIPEDFSDEDLLEGLDQNSAKNIKRISRCYRPATEKDIGKEKYKLGEQNEWVPSEEIKIYCTSSLPEYILIHKASRKVHKFIFPLRRCFRCQRFGHNYNSCRHSVRCVKCGGDHERAHCTVNYRKCANCKENHSAYDEECIFHKFHRFLNETRAKLNLGFREALNFIVIHYPELYNSSISNAQSLLFNSLFSEESSIEIETQPENSNNEIDHIAFRELIRNKSIKILESFTGCILDSFSKTDNSTFLENFSEKVNILSKNIITENFEELKEPEKILEESKTNDSLLDPKDVNMKED